MNLRSWRLYLNNIGYTIYCVLVNSLIDRKIGIIYKKFQFKLKLTKDTIDYAQKLHETLMKKAPFKYESPYLIVPICLYTVSRISKQPQSLSDFAELSHIKEDDLRKCYDMVFEEIKISLKKLEKEVS